MKIDYGEGYIQLVNFTPRLESELFPDSLLAYSVLNKDSVQIKFITVNAGYRSSSFWVKWIIDSTFSDSFYMDSLAPNYYSNFSFTVPSNKTLFSTMVIVDPANLDSEIIETNNVISKKWYRSSMPVPIITKSRNIKIEKRFYFKVYDIQGRVVLQSHNGVNILHDNKINKYYKRFILD